MEYKELQIICEDKSQLRIVKPSGISQPGRIPMYLNPLKERIITTLSQMLAEGKLSRVEELVVLGSCLYDGLFDTETSNIIEQEQDKIQKLPSTVLRLTFEFGFQAAELADLPWEYLYKPDTEREKGYFFATRSRLILIRHVSSREKAARNAKANEKLLRILLVVSTPDDPGSKDVDSTVKTIEKLRSRFPDTFATHTLRLPTLQAIKNSLFTFQPNVLHFIGHARSDQSESSLALMTEEKEVDLVSGYTLANLLLASSLRLVFLQPCGDSRMYDHFRDMSLQLALAGLPAVVSLQYPLEESIGNRFIESMYRSLGEGKPVDVAVQDGRQVLKTYLDGERGTSTRAFGSPLAYIQKPESIVIEGKRAQRIDSQYHCPNCGVEVRPEQNFCYNCGKQLSQCPQCQQMMLKDKICGNCGFKAAITL